MRVGVWRTAELEAKDLAQLEHWLLQVLGTDAYTWFAFDRHALVWIDGRIVSHVGVTERTITVDGQAMRVGGVGGVATPPEWRKQGLATEALKEAATFLCDRQGLDWILLLCSQELVPFYQDLGWQAVQAALWFDQPGGRTWWPEEIMVRPCHGQPWPRGAIDLCGLPW
jgi:GNAT superfamily N-acetyltransferase